VPFIDRAGVRIHYEETGSGAAVLLTHGYSATLEMWSRQIDELARRARLIRWDLRGHGDSDSPEDVEAYSHEATIADMAAVLDACGVRRAVVGGLSLGGYLSLEFHLAHPDRVSALLLFDTGPGYRKEEPRAEWNRLAERYARAFEEKGLEVLGGGAEVRVARHRSAQGLARAARGILAQRDSRVIDSLPEIRVPTLLVVGAGDEAFIGGMEYMAKKIPNAKLVLIEGAGHAPNLEKPDDFNRAVVEFLDGLPPA
jgi:pimeloyl-ACP methyl ester carboxylesterase